MNDIMDHRNWDNFIIQNTTPIERPERIVRHTSKQKVRGTGGKMIYMKRNGTTSGVKTKQIFGKCREKHTNQQKRMNRSKKNDITFMKRNQMKKCQIR